MLTAQMWKPFSTYLYIDKKISMSRKSQEQMKSQFNRLVKRFSKVSFDRANFNQYIMELMSQKYRHSTLNRIVSFAKHVDSFLKRNELTDYTHFRLQKVNKEILTPEEIKKMAEFTTIHRYHCKEVCFMYKTLIYFLGTTGCRRAEALDLKWQHVTNSLVEFTETKTYEDRFVPISEMVYKLLESLPKRSERVFTTPRGTRLDEQGLLMELKKRAKILGINKNVSPHTFRHSFITTMLEQGVDLLVLGKIVGHRQVETTKKYDQRNISSMVIALQSHPLMHETQTEKGLLNTITSLTDKLYDRSMFMVEVVVRKLPLAINH